MAMTRRALAAAGFLLAGPRGVAAQPNWQAATAWPPGNPFTRLLRRFCEEAGAGDQPVAIRVLDSGGLGGVSQIRQAVQSGQAQMGDILLAGNAQGDPLLELDAVPMLVRDLAQARRLATVTRAAVEQRLQRDGLTLLYWVPWPGAGLYSGFAIDSLEVLRGTRLRTTTPGGARMAALAGAMVAKVEREDMPSAFASRQASVLLASTFTGVDLEVWRFAQYFTPIASAFPKNAVCVQTRALEALSTPRRAALRQLADHCEEAGWAMIARDHEVARQVLIDHGMTLRPPSPKLVAELKRLGAVILDEWLERAGPPGRRLLDAYREG